VLYQGPVADAIRHFKYASKPERVRDLSPLLVEAALAHAGTVDVVVPMPLHPDKLRARGCNPSALLARPVARALGVPLCDHWLRRVRSTAAQAGLSRDGRVRNVSGAFAAKEVPAARVLLIDDVRTTSATLDEAARCLAARGHDVYTLALAWAERDARALGDGENQACGPGAV
jgi:predicted amidophosphoribosyltransferase